MRFGNQTDFGNGLNDGFDPWGSPIPGFAVYCPLVDVSPPEGTTVLYAPDGNSKLGAGGASSGSGTGSGTSSGTVTSGSTGTSPFVINITWDSSVASAPAAFKTAVLDAVQYLESAFSDPVTVNISVGYGEVDGTALGSGDLGSSQSLLTTYSYSSLLAALTKDETSALDKTAVASLPATAPVSGTLWTTTAEAKALGLNTTTSTTDGYVGFSSTAAWSYSDTSGDASGTYDFYGVAVHELTEVMGRLLLTGSTVGSTASSYSMMDLFHYQSAGVRDFSGSTPGYFSANGGTTSLGAFNTVSGGDPGDWASSVTNDSFDAFSNSGVVNAVTANDLSVLDALGWNLAPAAPAASTSAPTGITIATATSSLNGAQSSAGLSAKASLAAITQSGGASGDSYSYTLGGASAASFALTTSGNTATLAVGGKALSGASGGTFYGLTVTPTDKTSGKSGPATVIGVIVASGTGDSVNVGTLSGSLGLGNPTFVYGVGGNDTLNASTMQGTVYFVGGSGADTMTGGRGINDYLYGAAADSTPKAPDVITAFKLATDTIDLTGLGTKLTYAGQIAAGAKLGADSIGWQQSGSNTLVYVNTTTAAVALTSASMEIQLTGLLAPTSANFLHA